MENLRCRTALRSTPVMSPGMRAPSSPLLAYAISHLPDGRVAVADAGHRAGLQGPAQSCRIRQTVAENRFELAECRSAFRVGASGEKMTVERRILVSGRYVSNKPVSYGGHDPYLGRSILACVNMSTALLTVNETLRTSDVGASCVESSREPRRPQQVSGAEHFALQITGLRPACGESVPSTERSRFMAPARRSVDHPPPRKSNSSVSSLRSASKRWASASMANHSRASMFHTWASSARLLRSQMS